MRSLRAIAVNLKQLTGDSDLAEVKDTINKIVDILAMVKIDNARDLDFSKVKAPDASVLSIQKWANTVLNLLKRSA